MSIQEIINIRLDQLRDDIVKARKSITNQDVSDDSLFAYSFSIVTLGTKIGELESILLLFNEQKNQDDTYSLEIVKKAFNTFRYLPFPHNNPTWEEFEKLISNH